MSTITHVNKESKNAISFVQQQSLQPTWLNPNRAQSLYNYQMPEKKMKHYRFMRCDNNKLDNSIDCDGPGALDPTHVDA